MAMIGSVFPVFQLLEEFLIQIETCSTSTDESHPRFMNKCTIYFDFTDIREIRCDQDALRRVFSEMLDQRLQEVTLEEMHSVINLLIALPP